MNTLKLKVVCDGQILGYIIITYNNPSFPNCVVGMIIPITRQGNWSDGDLTLIFERQITNLYNHTIPIDENTDVIINDLLQRAGINRNTCNNFQLIPAGG